MCGIIAYFGKREAAPILIDGLKKLEYRGYDSAGICLLKEGNFRWAKVSAHQVSGSVPLAKGETGGYCKDSNQILKCLELPDNLHTNKDLLSGIPNRTLGRINLEYVFLGYPQCYFIDFII